MLLTRRRRRDPGTLGHGRPGSRIPAHHRAPAPRARTGREHAIEQARIAELAQHGDEHAATGGAATGALVLPRRLPEHEPRDLEAERDRVGRLHRQIRVERWKESASRRPCGCRRARGWPSRSTLGGVLAYGLGVEALDAGASALWAVTIAISLMHS
jgi:hypothetical protein